MQREVRTVWNNCLRIIQEGIPEQSFKTWFEPIVPLKLENHTLTIQVPSQFFYEWLEENYVHLLRKAIDAEIGRHGLLEYSITVDKGGEKKPPIDIRVTAPKPSMPPPPQRQRTVEPDIRSPFNLPDLDGNELTSYLNPIYTFDNYVEGDCNRLARAAGIAVAQKPGVTSFNPLMVFGGVGLGKTHLVQAIGNHIKGHNSGKFVLYVSTEKFTNQYIIAVRNNNVQNFSNFYLRVDVLILDDVQFLSGKEKTQETFFHIFNHLHQSGKQIIMTSDRPPRELQGLEDRLLSRFKWGMTADLQTPDLETRIAIILKKLQADGIDIPYEVVEYLAHSIDTNVRELEGVIVSLMAHASLNRRDIDLDLARSTLRHIVVDSEKVVTVEGILEAVTGHFNVELSELKGKSRKKETVYPRQVAMYLAKEFTDLSLKSIGYHFGGRDHSTVIHAIQTISEAMQTNKKIQAEVNQLQRHFGGK
ncbi:MAG: chromosomal replication initiator protein DnaA [Cytophagaceae bacterium]|nr:chromosomal replication initiator protein DnaA [Cytophagaceae bacterium]